MKVYFCKKEHATLTEIASARDVLFWNIPDFTEILLFTRTIYVTAIESAYNREIL
jgi:hypothetical protein